MQARDLENQELREDLKGVKEQLESAQQALNASGALMKELE